MNTTPTIDTEKPKNYFWMISILVIILFSFLAVSLPVKSYNKILATDEAVVASWGDVEAAYQRRADLIPNLVEVVKGYATHEKETLTAVTEARAKIAHVSSGKSIVDNQGSLAEFQASQTGLNSALSRLLVVIERYPDLKANQGFRDMMHQLEGTENRINVARKRYNDAVNVFNVTIRSFPNALINNLSLQLTPRAPFKADIGAEKAPTVTF